MPVISFLKPTDQPTGAARLIDELRRNLASPDFDEMRMVVAFAKHGPLLRLQMDITRWRSLGKPIRAVFGIDQRGTSQQALDFALGNFDETYIAHVGEGPFNPTFHPKIYLFLGAGRTIAFIGSNNLTVGGTETNLESGIRLDLASPADDAVRAELLACWEDAVKTSLPLDVTLLSRLIATGMVADENQMQRGGPKRSPAVAGGGTLGFPGMHVRPPSPIPAASMRPRPTPRRAEKRAPAPPRATAQSVGTQALVIQIVPHHNGEVFLSKVAANQNPAFFGWPFTGQTIPKKPTNPSYPQRTPDPVVDLKVYNSTGKLIVRHNPFNLNTVYYEKKSEIRITVPPDVVNKVPEGSVMVMRQAAEQEDLDYDVDIYVKGSPEYKKYLGVCNQTMPSGGKAQARKFGWL